MRSLLDIKVVEFPPDAPWARHYIDVDTAFQAAADDPASFGHPTDDERIAAASYIAGILGRVVWAIAATNAELKENNPPSQHEKLTAEIPDGGVDMLSRGYGLDMCLSVGVDPSQAKAWRGRIREFLGAVDRPTTTAVGQAT